MKKLIFSLCFFLMCGLSVNVWAQTAEVDNGYWLNGGQIMQLREGTLVPLTERVVLPNGLTLLPNGDLVTRQGVRRNLQQGQAIDASGRILYPQTQRNGSIILVPRSAYISDRDPGIARPRKERGTSRRPSLIQPGQALRPSGNNSPNMVRPPQAKPNAGKVPGHSRRPR